MLSGECSACHGNGAVSTSSSSGSNGFNLGCNGCHGRPESAAGGKIIAAGLRQHHWNNGITDCVVCHSDSNPASFTTVGENVLPPYYFTPDTAHPNKPTDPCNPNGEENFAGTSIGLDNDGDGLYDLNDDNCQVTTAPDINLNPAALNLGSLLIGNANTLDTQIENLGNADLVVSTIAAGSGTSTEFSFTAPTTPFTLPGGGSQTVSITYQPVNAGTDSGTVVITSNDPVTPTVSLTLNGTGDAVPTPDINITPTTLNYNTVMLGKTLTLTPTIQNLGTAALTINTISLCTGTSTEFSWLLNTPITFQAKTSTTLPVTYAPFDENTDTGCLSIASDDPDEPTVNVSVQATGVIYKSSILRFLPPILNATNKKPR